jgi:anaerobic selenocysteine-containing dehydrogenase
VELRRRTFLKTAALAAAAGALPGCERQAHRLIPYLLPDDEIIPGVANWYASTCRECAAGCGMLVRVMEGRAKKVEGNPDHPLNQGKLCAKGQASLQGLYNPDRLREPLHRKGHRGAGAFEPIGWDEGLNRVAEALRGRAAPIMITKPVSGTLSRLLSDFMKALGGRLYRYAPDAEIPLHAAWRDSVGSDVAPRYDFAHADYLLSFGAPFLEQWLSPVAMGIAFGRMRQGRPATRGRFIQIEPRMSLTGANADRWIPIKPGTEGLLALGIGHVMLRDDRFTLSKQEKAPWKTFYGSVDLEEVERATEIPHDLIVRLALDFLSARAPLAIGGGPACAHTNGTISLMAIHGLNILAGKLGHEACVQVFPHADDSAIPWLTERTVIDLVQQHDMEAPGALLLYDSNPLFTMPPSVPIKRLFEQTPFCASFSAFLDESSEWADLVLPDRAMLESWDDHVADTGGPTIGLSQPVVRPLYADTRQVGDTLLDLGRRLGLDVVHASTFYDLLRERWRGFLDKTSHDDAPDWFEKAWVSHLQQGGWWHEPGRTPHPLAFKPAHRYEPAVLSGDEQSFPFILYPYPSMTIGHGEGANRPWLQELPDTMTSVVWGSWLEVNPMTAQELGIQQGDLVRVTSPVGSLDTPAVLYPGIRPDVVAMPLGQGHSGYGRYARGRGVNPLTLLLPALDSVTGIVASGATRVRIERTGIKGRLVTVEHPAMEQSDLITIKRR